MGYAKYNEDISDRWVDDTRDREEAFFRQWQVDHVPTPPLPAGEVCLEIKGRRLEDEEVFPAGSSVKAKCVVRDGSAPIELFVIRAGKRALIRPDATGIYTIQGSDAKSIEIDAISGAYHKYHILHFVESAHIDRIEGLAEAISSFTANPPGWTREQFEAFRGQLHQLLAKNSVPQSFADGLVEYFLGVQLEAAGNPAYRDRLEAAFVLLRKFAPFSDLAALIAEYFRYRTNTFSKATSESGRHKRPLSGITEFFAGKSGIPKPGNEQSRGVELIVPEVEFCCFEAIRAMSRGEAETALGLVAVSRKLKGNLDDPQREERLRLIEARAFASGGQSKKAYSVYQLLLFSPCAPFQDEARQYLRP
jgi:hypothetical protein